jgi:hypothetical protein
MLKTVFLLKFSVDYGVFITTEDRFILHFGIQISVYLSIVPKCFITLETTRGMKKNKCKNFLVLFHIQTINATSGLDEVIY